MRNILYLTLKPEIELISTEFFSISSKNSNPVLNKSVFISFISELGYFT